MESIADKTYSISLRNKLKKLYEKISANQLKEIANFDLLLNISSNSVPIVVNIIGKSRSFINESFIHDYSNNWYGANEKPIESIVLYSNEMQCFTYFSDLQDYWHSFRLDLQKFIITIKNNFTEYAPVDKYYISMHLQNKLPEFYTTSRFNYLGVNPNFY